jgi:Tfp pilus assembly protein PilN
MMFPLELDFAPGRRPHSWLALVVCVAGIVAVLIALADLVDAREELALADARLLRLQQRQKLGQNLQRRGDTAAQTAVETPALRNIVTRLNMPWNGMLQELEQQADASVALLSIESQGQGRSLRLTGEARTMADVLAYVGRLGASPGIAAATLSGHEERASGAVRRVRFSLDVTWRPQQ